MSDVKKSYQSFIEKVCCCEKSKMNDAERDGYWGVACIMACINGVDTSVNRISEHLGVDRNFIERPFRRLAYADYLQDDIIKNDQILKSSCGKKNKLNDDEVRNAWCIVAGIASGFIVGKRVDCEK